MKLFIYLTVLIIFQCSVEKFDNRFLQVIYFIKKKQFLPVEISKSDILVNHQKKLASIKDSRNPIEYHGVENQKYDRMTPDQTYLSQDLNQKQELNQNQDLNLKQDQFQVPAVVIPQLQTLANQQMNSYSSNLITYSDNMRVINKLRSFEQEKQLQINQNDVQIQVLTRTNRKLILEKNKLEGIIDKIHRNALNPQTILELEERLDNLNRKPNFIIQEFESLREQIKEDDKSMKFLNT